MSLVVAVVGAGRMGSVVLKQLPKDTKKIVIDTSFERAKEIAEMVGGTAFGSLEGAKEADLIAVVLPTPAVNETVDKLMAIVKKGAIIINMATGAQIDPAIKEKNQDVYVIDTKIIGHAKAMAQGEPGLIIAKTEDEKIFNIIKGQLPGYIDVVKGDADIVPEINAIGTSEGIKAAVATKKQLEMLNIPEKWINVAIRTCCAGTMKSYTENDLGHFAQELVKKLEAQD